MELARLMLKYYINTAKRSWKMCTKNWMALIMLCAYSVILYAASFILLKIYFVGGIIYAIVVAACGGSWLYMAESIINNRIVDFEDFKYSFKPYTIRVLNVTFYIWVAGLIYSMVISRLFQMTAFGWIFDIIVYIAVLVILNPLPELIYQTYHPELQLFRDSLEFIRDNFLEWMIPNAVLGAAFYLLFVKMPALLPVKIGADIIKYIAAAFLVLYGSVYRGILFRFLNESTRRSRLFKLRMLE